MTDIGIINLVFWLSIFAIFFSDFFLNCDQMAESLNLSVFLFLKLWKQPIPQICYLFTFINLAIAKCYLNILWH